eukprot:CAMPEP_0119377762 /NCGR_PEP_ID=MMETSP1334-20130426/46502_1 /TAXON_ID=127549 /ORGANISM="Calcidiscus leptoporus, Strain RCC1130" /LENGTH=420 /DNA_ID=CAMNT_0007396779 /DNA_START=118 /DNA_END=1380 /DNA_ORIENTATION=-
MELDFDAASRRFERDSSSRQKLAAEKRAAQRVERERARAQRQQREREQNEREKEALVRAAELERIRDEDLERNRGVVYHATLRANLSLEGEARRIRRRADKVTLPHSAASELSAASKNGALFFELTAPGTKTHTHSSLLDFSAAEGTIGVPPEVLRCLGLSADGNTHTDIDVRYKPLRKGTFARVQPLTSQFRADIDDVKVLLEREMHLRTTLSVGDEIEVGEEKRHALRILELKPESAVSLIDTDLEVEVSPSVEEEEQVAHARAQAEAAAAAQAAAAQAAAAAAAMAEAEARRAIEEQIAATAAAETERRLRRSVAVAALPAPPASSSEGVVSVAIRCPDGQRLLCRFDRQTPLEALFLLVEAEWHEAEGSRLLPADFKLVSAFPRRALTRSQLTLEAVGLGSAQEVLLVELPSIDER